MLLGISVLTVIWSLVGSVFWIEWVFGLTFSAVIVINSVVDFVLLVMNV